MNINKLLILGTNMLYKFHWQTILDVIVQIHIIIVISVDKFIVTVNQFL